jgi:uncharacterized protein (UPF0264 family)
MSQSTKITTDKHEKLSYLANKRVPIAIKRIKLCGNLAAYKPTTAQVDAIVGALVQALDDAKDRLYRTKREKQAFLLPQ